MSYFKRTAFTVLLFVLFGFVFQFHDAVSGQVLSNVSVSQLDNSNSGAFAMLTTHTAFGLVKILELVLLFAGLAALWTKPLSDFIKSLGDKTIKSVTAAALAITLGAAMLFAPPPAQAYYDKSDYSEYYVIGANQSAFLIPMTGANKDNQKQFGSVDYLAANKVAAKMIQIPHVKADNTGNLRDYYIPGAKLYLLDRTPVSREWAKGAKGTSTKDESFYFESADSINISTDIAISAYVTEENAAKFFYWFGSQTQANSQDPTVMFASVVNGRSLHEVVDTVVRTSVQTNLAKEFGKLSLDDAIKNKATIIDTVLAAVVKEFEPKGITISTLGYADSLTFEKDIQQVMNDNFVANRKLSFKNAYDVSLSIEQREADIMVRRSEGMAIQKWNGSLNLPSFLMLPEGLMQKIMGWFGSAPSAASKQ